MNRTLLLAGAALAAAMPAFALQVQHTRPELCVLADRVAVVEITEVKDLRDMKGAIERVVAARVDQGLKNASTDSLTFRLLGGRIGDDALWVSDQPPLVVGASYIVFLDGTGDDALVYGGEQGAIRLMEGGTTLVGEKRDEAIASLGGCGDAR
ncbi:MAG: hypothetical protein H6736_00545 [Alphaproteobacteria bacterium]|nr:hypothetical protein [Alphaproteobacteria bacterium]